MQQQDHEIGWEYRKRADRHWANMILFATLLLISHLLEIKPADIDAEGIKIAVEDVAVIRGGLALVFLYFAFMTFQSFVSGSILLPFKVERELARQMLRVTRGARHRPPPRAAKRRALIVLTVYQLVMAPFYLAITTLVVISLVLSAYDCYAFGRYAAHKLTSGQAVARPVVTTDA
jgi:hypothetical protein